MGHRGTKPEAKEIEPDLSSINYTTNVYAIDYKEAFVNNNDNLNMIYIFITFIFFIIMIILLKRKSKK